MQHITPFFWFDKEAEEAARFYVTTFKKVFKDSKLGSVMRYNKESAEASGQPEGTAMTVELRLAGMDFVALNGGRPENFPTEFTGAISFVISCPTQKDIDYFWDKMVEGGGETSQCGWLKDRFGVSWQVVPRDMIKYLGGKDKAGARRATGALMDMTKIELSELKRAYENK